MPKLGPYSKEIVLAKADRRTREGRLLMQVRTELTRQLGGEANLTAMQRALIERCAMLQLRVAALRGMGAGPRGGPGENLGRDRAIYCWRRVVDDDAPPPPNESTHCWCSCGSSIGPHSFWMRLAR
jgi:hypothetical protein